MSTLLSAVSDLVSDQLVGAAADKLGEDPGAVAQGIGGLASTLLAGIAGKAGGEGGLGDLFDLLSNETVAGFADNPAQFIDQGNLAQGDPKDIAGNLIGGLFGDKVGPILGALTSIAGFKTKGTSGSLLGMVGPMVLGVLSKKVLGGGLNAGTLAKLFLGEKSALEAAVPGPIASLLGFGQQSAAPVAAAVATPAPVEETRSAPPAAAVADDERRKGGMGWLWWLLPLLLIGAGIWWLMNRTPPKVTVPDVPTVELPEVPTVPVETPDVPVPDITAPVVPAIDLIGNALSETGLVAFLNSEAAPCTQPACWFTMRDLTFESGSTNLDMTSSADQLTNLSRIMAAYPDMQLKIGGYTDNTGDVAANVALSQTRADAVAAALVDMGVGAERLNAEGYGAEHPVASNDTEEGRAQNRRIDVRVRQR